MTAREILEEILISLKNIKGVEESAVVTRDGLLVSSTVSQTSHADTFVAMAATMFGAGEIASIELGKGATSRIIVESRTTKLIATGAGPKVLLVVMTRPDAGLGMILLEMKKASDKIKEVL